MYLSMVVLLMGALPVGSILIVYFLSDGYADPAYLIAKWFVFWSVGVRLLLAGLRQVANPRFTADTIFGLKDEGALVVVRELGFANLSIGVLGALSLARPDWIVPSAIVGGLYYGLAGILHLRKGERNFIENVAMTSDLLLFAVLAIDLAVLALRSA
jgi:hypothetical protein